MTPVQDPELQKSLVELNMIRNVNIDGGTVSFTLVLTTPACPLREFIVEDCQKAVKQLPDVEEVVVDVTAETPQQHSLPDRQGIDEPWSRTGKSVSKCHSRWCPAIMSLD